MGQNAHAGSNSHAFHISIHVIVIDLFNETGSFNHRGGRKDRGERKIDTP